MALAAVLVALVGCSSSPSREARCRTYKDALIVALDSPNQTDTPRGLTPQDRDAIVASRASYLDDVQKQTLAITWKQFADHYEEVALARRGC